MILLIDNYDSFVHNLARYFIRLGQQVRVVRNDAITCDEIVSCRPEAIVVSPGPCTPSEAGVSVEAIQRFHQQIPILGVCLGHQAIAAALGGRLVRSEPVHGRTSAIHHTGQGVFAGLPPRFAASRYHSLAIDEASLPPELQVTARTDDGLVMAVQHSQCPLVGVQFHPEAVLSEHGFELLAAFLHLAGLSAPASLPQHELAIAPPAPRPVLNHPSPVTF